MCTGSRDCVALDRRRLLRALATCVLALAGPLHAETGAGFTVLPERPPAPDFALADENGRLWKLSSLRGKVVVVNFWATWCPPCRRELPSLERLRRALPPDQALVLGINVGESWDTVASFIAGVEPAPAFPILYDEKSSVLKAWPVRGLPTTFVVDRQGRIALRAVGGREFDQAGPMGQIGSILGEK